MSLDAPDDGHTIKSAQFRHLTVQQKQIGRYLLQNGNDHLGDDKGASPAYLYRKRSIYYFCYS